jgi:hypothetical protein
MTWRKLTIAEIEKFSLQVLYPLTGEEWESGERTMGAVHG